MLDVAEVFLDDGDGLTLALGDASSAGIVVTTAVVLMLAVIVIDNISGMEIALQFFHVVLANSDGQLEEHDDVVAFVAGYDLAAAEQASMFFAGLDDPLAGVVPVKFNVAVNADGLPVIGSPSFLHW